MRIGLPTNLETRDGTIVKDARMVNSFINDDAVYKRPAVNSVLATASGQAQGMQPNNNLIYMINGDTLRSYNSAFVLQQIITL